MDNVNCMQTKIKDNEKLVKAKELLEELEASIYAIQEHQINPKHKSNVNGLSQMFRGGEAEVRSQIGHNTHENISRRQEGGTGMVLYGELIDQYDASESGRDPSGLGSWVVMVFWGSDGITTRIVSAYNPCKNNRPHSRTTYQQHCRY